MTEHTHSSCGHSHGIHGHHHAPVNFNRRFAIGAAVNMVFVVAELGFGFISNSLGLIADAAHNFSDVLGLLLAWAGAWLSQMKPTRTHTYGYSSASILAALGNAILLFVAVVGILIHAIHRIFSPAEVQGMMVVWVALIGVGINGGTAMLFHKGQAQDLNIRGAYLHMMADAGISLGVVLAGLIIMWTGWLWIDPVISILIAAIIFVSTWDLAKESLHLSLAAVPRHVDVDAVTDYFMAQPGVTEVHDLHIWNMSTTKTALTVHLLRPGHDVDDGFLTRVTVELKEKFNIEHPTIQLETGGDKASCAFAPADVL